MERGWKRVEEREKGNERVRERRADAFEKETGRERQRGGRSEREKRERERTAFFLWPRLHQEK